MNNKVFVLNRYGKPLMPCSPRKARLLMDQGKARPVSSKPFTIKLTYWSTGYVQPLVAGMDTGSKFIAVSVKNVEKKEIIYSAEIKIRDDVHDRMDRRKMYRVNRRKRTRYRQPRWSNRANSKREGRLSPTVISKINSHYRERDFVNSILPITEWKVELAKFDIHLISNPEVSGVGYQYGPQFGYNNVKEYVKERDGYQCKSGQKVNHTKYIEVHHLLEKSQQGYDAPENLRVLCTLCHTNLHLGLWSVKGRKSKTKNATHMNFIQLQLKKSDWDFEETDGATTKFKREQILKLPKSHINDSIAICCDIGEIVSINRGNVYQKKHIPKGEYRQTDAWKGYRKLHTGKLHGFKNGDYVTTPYGKGFVSGRRVKNKNLDIVDITGKKFKESINIKKVKRIIARKTVVVDMIKI